MTQILFNIKIAAYGAAAAMVLYCIYVAAGAAKGTRKFTAAPFPGKLAAGLLAMCPVLLGILLLPFADTEIPFGTALAQLTDNSDAMAAAAALLAAYLVYYSTLFFRHHNKYYNLAPPMVVVSLLPSITNASIIFLINLFLSGSSLQTGYMSFYFMLNVYLFAWSTKSIKELSLIVSENVTADLNTRIIRDVFLSDYQQFEKEKKGSLFLVLGDYVNQLSVFSMNLVALYTNVLTVFIVLIYLLFSHSIAVLSLFAVVVVILLAHYLMGLKTAVYFNEAGKVRSKYMEKLLGVVNGFKELSLHRVKRDRYRREVEELSAAYTGLIHNASRKYIKRVMLSDMSFIVSIGLSCFAFPLIFGMQKQELVTYILAALFMWGPLNIIIKTIPEVVAVRTSLRRIRAFIGKARPAGNNELPVPLQDAPAYAGTTVESLEVKDLYFEYPAREHTEEQYFIGPLNFTARGGEITFIIGGNGSGKTTFAKLLSGLYPLQQGVIRINGKEALPEELGEYFSVIFSDFHLFRKVYSEKEVSRHHFELLSQLMKLDGKVEFSGDEFSTLDLSRGQCKRVAIIQCFMEDRPVFLFDECAADQDPEFKKFFYNRLLPEIKRMGKVLVVITHDDSYFDIADRIYKMETGQMTLIKNAVSYHEELAAAEN